MKHNAIGLIWSICCLSYLTFSPSVLQAKQAPALQVRGLLETQGPNTTIPEFAIHFDGTQAFNREDGFFSFTTDRPYETVGVLVCEEFTPSMKKRNTIGRLELPQGTRYRYFTPSKKKHAQDWVEKKLPVNTKLNDQKRRNGPIVPKNCLILLMSPDLVEKITTWDLDVNDGPSVLSPKIILKGTPKKINLASQSSLLRSMDVAWLFRLSKTKHEWKKPTLKVSSIEYPR